MQHFHKRKYDIITILVGTAICAILIPCQGFPNTRQSVIPFSLTSTLCRPSKSIVTNNYRSLQQHHHRHQRHQSSKRSGTELFLSQKNAPIKIRTKQIDLSTGINAEIMVCRPHDDKSPISSLQMIFSSKAKPPLVFIHGSFHASWCWAEKFFPFFANLGYPCYALSLRGTGATFAGEGLNRVKIMDHVSDIAAFLDYVVENEEGARPPVLLAHSFGGLAIMKYLEKYLYIKPKSPRYSIPGFLSGSIDAINNNTQYKEGLPHQLSGVCLMCSVPPSGNGKMTLRFLKQSFKDSWKITKGLAMKKCISDEALCRVLFFGGKIVKEDDKIVQDWGISDEDIKRYQGYFERDTVATINLRDLSKILPSANVDRDGRAHFSDLIPPALVLGAEDDFIVDKTGVIETAKYFGVEPTMIDSPHDVMLGSKWENSASSIAQWLQSLNSSG